MKLFLTALFVSLTITAIAQKAYWSTTLTTGEYGNLQTNFFVEKKGAFLIGTTSPNAHKRIVGGLKASFAKSMFQTDGSLIELDSVAFDGADISGYLILEKKKYFLKGKKEGKTITSDLLGKSSGKIYGKLEATEVDAAEKPKEYTLLWNEIKELTEKYIYNKTVLQSKEWISFCKEMQSFAFYPLRHLRKQRGCNAIRCARVQHGGG